MENSTSHRNFTSTVKQDGILLAGVATFFAALNIFSFHHRSPKEARNFVRFLSYLVSKLTNANIYKSYQGFTTLFPFLS